MKKGILTLLLSFLLFFAVASDFLYAQPILNSSNGHYYQLVYRAQGITWYDARNAAASMTFNGWQGHLATVTSNSEEAFLLNNFPEIGGPENIWLGGSDEAIEGNWRWITGETWSYTNWDASSGEPNGGSLENCLEYTDGVAAWNDQSCDSQRLYFLVEYEAPASRTTAVPTLTEWGMIIFMLLAGLGSVYYLKRQRRA